VQSVAAVLISCIHISPVISENSHEVKLAIERSYPEGIDSELVFLVDVQSPVRQHQVQHLDVSLSSGNHEEEDSIS